MNGSTSDQSPTRALAAFAFGSHSRVADTSRPLAWLSPDEMAIDLSDPVQRRFGDYELIEKVGQGGMGVVYRARQHGLERDVALKLLAAGPWASAEFVERFRREAKSAARMQHPNIVEIYEFGHRDGLNYFSMRLIDGQSLGQKLAVDGPMAPKDAAKLLRILAEAMDYAHRLGVLHLDLKPTNVLLTKAGQPLIADFGLARRIDAGHEGGGEISGTPSYMAPEQAQLESYPLTASTDIYGLGAILYECLTGRPPFVGGTAQNTLERVITDAPLAPRQISKAIPADLEAICLKCLAKDPKQRYATARDLAEDFGGFLANRPVSARVPDLWERTQRWWAQHRIGVAMFALLLAGIVGTTKEMLKAEAERGRAIAAAAEMEKAVELSVHLFTGGTQMPDNDELRRRSSGAVMMLRNSTNGDDELLARVLGAFTTSLARVKGPEGAQSIVEPILESFGAPFRVRVAQAWDVRAGGDAAVIAALWSRPAYPDTRENPHLWDVRALSTAGQFAARLRRAHDQQPDHRMSLFVAALYCEPRAGECAIPDAAHALALLEPENAANWALAADRGQVDMAMRRQFLHKAAEARRFDDRFSELFELYRRGFDGSGIALPPVMLRPLTAAAGVDRPAFLPIYWEFLQRPFFPQQAFVSLCDPRGTVVDDAGVRADCIAYATLLVKSRGGLLHNHVGQTILRRLLKGTPAEHAMIEQRRNYLWMAEQPGVMQVVAERGGSWEDLMTDASRVGEMEAFKLRMERLGHARTPPPGWTPSAPDALLLPEDRPVTTEASQ